MFGNEETLIVVYKDEMVLNQFKKLAESRNRDQEYLANHPELNIIAWNEKTWLNNKKAGNIRGKILYLGQLKGTKELIPVIDIKFQICFSKFFVNELKQSLILKNSACEQDVVRLRASYVRYELCKPFYKARCSRFCIVF